MKVNRLIAADAGGIIAVVRVIAEPKSWAGADPCHVG
jgi:hypothetical protein